MLDRERRLTVAHVARSVGLIAVLFGPGVVYTGIAEPYVSPPAYVFGEVDVVLIMLGGFGLLYVFDPTELLRSRYWKRAATECGLTPVSGGLFRAPECTGTVRGREVRARTGARGALSSGSRGRYTVVETALSDEATGGVVVGSTDRDGLTAYDIAASPDAEADGLVAAGSSDGLAGEVLDDHVTSTLGGAGAPGQLYAGDAKAAGDTLPDDERVPFGTYPGVTSEIDAAHDDGAGGRDWLGGRGWVSHACWGTVVEPEELGRQLDAVLAVADALERASARNGGAE